MIIRYQSGYVKSKTQMAVTRRWKLVRTKNEVLALGATLGTNQTIHARVATQ